MIKDLAENKGHDGQPPVRPLREIMEVNDTEKEDPHNADPGPGTVDDQEDLDHAAPTPTNLTRSLTSGTSLTRINRMPRGGLPRPTAPTYIYKSIEDLFHLQRKLNSI